MVKTSRFKKLFWFFLFVGVLFSVVSCGGGGGGGGGAAGGGSASGTVSLSIPITRNTAHSAGFSEGISSLNWTQIDITISIDGTPQTFTLTAPEVITIEDISIGSSVEAHAVITTVSGTSYNATGSIARLAPGENNLVMYLTYVCEYRNGVAYSAKGYTSRDGCPLSPPGPLPTGEAFLGWRDVSTGLSNYGALYTSGLPAGLTGDRTLEAEYGIVLNKSSTTLYFLSSLPANDTLSVGTSLNPGVTVTWSSSDSSLVTVALASATSCSITCASEVPGTAVITATTSDGKVGKCYVKVDSELAITADGTVIGNPDYKDTTTTITIPATINGIPVTKIGVGAFSNWTNLTSVTLPTSITEFGVNAFCDCSNLTTINLNAVFGSGHHITISQGAFARTKIGGILTIPLNVEFNGGDNTNYFLGCTEITEVVCEAQTGMACFSNCTGITKVTLGYDDESGTQWVGSSAFVSCGTIPEVILKSSIQKIGTYAFDATTITTLTMERNSVVELLKDGSNINSIFNAYNAGTIKVPSALVTSYPTATNWSNRGAGVWTLF